MISKGETRNFTVGLSYHCFAVINQFITDCANDSCLCLWLTFRPLCIILQSTCTIGLISFRVFLLYLCSFLQICWQRRDISEKNILWRNVSTYLKSYFSLWRSHVQLHTRVIAVITNAKKTFYLTKIMPWIWRVQGWNSYIYFKAQGLHLVFGALIKEEL